MPQISLTDFKATQEAAERRQRLAAALREQSTSPIQIQSYNGIQAPIPVTEVLVKALQGYLGGRQEKKAAEALAEGRAKARREAMDFVKGLKQETPQDRFIAPPNFQPEQPGIIDRLKQAGQQFMPQQPQPVAASQQPMVAPPTGAPMVPAQPMAMPQQTQPQGPYSGYNGPGPMDVSELRGIPAELQNRARSPEEQQQMLLDAAMSGNPYLEKIAPQMYEDVQSKAKASEERQRQIEIIRSLDIPEDRKEMLLAGMSLDTDNPLIKQAFQDEQYNQGTSGVEARALDKYMKGEPLTAGEKRVVESYFAVQGKRAYTAPPRGNSPGRARSGIRTQVGNDGKTYYSPDGVNWYDNRAEAGG